MAPTRDATTTRQCRIPACTVVTIAVSTPVPARETATATLLVPCRRSKERTTCQNAPLTLCTEWGSTSVLRRRMMSHHLRCAKRKDPIGRRKARTRLRRRERHVLHSPDNWCEAVTETGTSLRIVQQWEGIDCLLGCVWIGGAFLCLSRFFLLRRHYFERLFSSIWHRGSSF